MKHLGDITQIRGDEIEPVDCIIGGSPCFPAGTLVLTNKGYTPIEELRCGDVVLTHKGNWKPISAIGHKQSPTIMLKGNHYGIITTPNHPFYSAEQDQAWNGNGYTRTLEKIGEWTEAAQMRGKRWAVPNDISGLSIPHISRTSARQNQPPVIDARLMYIIGRYLGDGWIRNGQRPNRSEDQTWGQIFICANTNKADYLEERLRDVFEGISAVKRFSERTVDKFRVSNQPLCEWIIEHFGYMAEGKKIPAWAYCMESEMRESLLCGYLDSDGYRHKENTWKATTVSKRLAHGIRLLAETLGYSCAVYYVDVGSTTTIEGRTVNQKPQYQVVMRKEKRTTCIKHGTYNWYMCRSVESYSDEQTVYNITVDEDHSYVVEGLVVHNCQDLSIAGKRAGLSGARSGLFMEQIRIVKEMRKQYGKPRYMVWENVPGAFSSNNGEDFRIVLEEIVRIIDESAVVPRPPKGKWSYAGCIVGDGYSVAWRTHDAQFWGVPQRRRRIALVADFGGESAPEILFERDSVSGDSEPRGEAREGSAADSQGCIGADDRDGTKQITLRVGAETPILDDQGGDRITVRTDGKAPTLRAGMHGNIPCVTEADKHGAAQDCLSVLDRPAVCYDITHTNDVIRYCGEVSPTLQARTGTGGNQVPLCIGNGQTDQLRASEKVDALSCMHDQQCIVSCSTIRRLTPLECERLQGYPDGWTDIGDWVDTKGKRHKSADTPRYKALGNSIALPFWFWMLRRMGSFLPADTTMGSLFDGIGGFPLCWETIHGKGSARWASEIEEFPIAVTKMRFPEEEE